MTPTTPTLWQQLPANPTPANTPDDPTAQSQLTLSPSSLSAWMDCPRRFYYERLLRLPQKPRTEANMGLWVHTLMELFHRSTAPQDHTMATLHRLATEVLNTDAPALAAYPDETIQALAHQLRDDLLALDPIARFDMVQRIKAALADMDRKGYFTWPEGHRLVTVLPEAQLAPQAIDGLEGCRWLMRPDVLLQLEAPDGERYWWVWDYKFYQPTAFAGAEKAQQGRITNVLNPLPCDVVDTDTGEVTPLLHAERFKQSEAKPRLYQLPLLYWRLQQDDRFKGQIRQLALKIIRPPFANNPKQGSITVQLSIDELEQASEDMKADLQTHVINAIASTHRYQAVGGRACLNCSYRAICDVGNEADGEDDDD
jgi:hypothetical protein